VAGNASSTYSGCSQGGNDCQAGSRYGSPRHRRPLLLYAQSALRRRHHAYTGDWTGLGQLCGFCSSRSSPHSQCKSSLSSGRKVICKRGSGRPIWIMPVACGEGFSWPMSREVLEALARIAELLANGATGAHCRWAPKIVGIRCRGTHATERLDDPRDANLRWLSPNRVQTRYRTAIGLDDVLISRCESMPSAIVVE
jgi:hypothetical protein